MHEAGPRCGGLTESLARLRKVSTGLGKRRVNSMSCKLARSCVLRKIDTRDWSNVEMILPYHENDLMTPGSNFDVGAFEKHFVSSSRRIGLGNTCGTASILLSGTGKGKP